MKIAYINFLQTKIVGVNKKLESFQHAVNRNNLNIDVIVINLEKNELINGIQYIKIPSNNLKYKIKRKLFRYNFFEEVIDFNKYDKVILRWSGLDLSVPSFINKYGKKIISEHHANELVQFKKNISSFSTYMSYLLTKVMYKKFLLNVKGIIGVTEEITKSHVLDEKIESLTISNGIDIENVEFSKFTPFLGEELNVSFIASSYARWHGLDRFLEGVKQYAGNVNIKLTIAGNFSKNDIIEILDYQNNKFKIVYKGMCNEKELDEILSNSNVAISTLAFFRVGINDGCPLKSREYLARGLPFIYAYNDLDLNDEMFFCKKFLSNEEPIDIEKVIDFVTNVSKNYEFVSKSMREFAIKKLSWDKKVLQISDFLDRI